MSDTGKVRHLPDVPEGKDEVALALEDSQIPIKKTSQPTESVRNEASAVQNEHLCTTMTNGASGGNMHGSNVAGVHHGDNYILYFQYPNTLQDEDRHMKNSKEFFAQLKTSISSLRSAHTLSCPAPMTVKGKGREPGDVNTDEHTTRFSHAEGEDSHLVTDDHLYLYLLQCDMSDVSDEDIQALKDDEVYCYIKETLACYNIRRSGPEYDPTTLGVKMRVTDNHHEDTKKDPLNAVTEEAISDVKLKSNLKGGKETGKPGKDILDGVDSGNLMDDCITSPKQLEDDRSENMVETCTKADHADTMGDMLLPSTDQLHVLNGIPGRCVQFKFDLRCIQSSRVRFITRHNVEKTVEIGKFLSFEKVHEVCKFLEALLNELDLHRPCTMSESEFYTFHPCVSISEIISIDLRDIQKMPVRVKTKQNVELILQIGAMKPPKNMLQEIEKFLSDMLLEEY